VEYRGCGSLALHQPEACRCVAGLERSLGGCASDSRSFLDEHGEHPADVAKAMNASLAGCTVYSDAVVYDRNWCQCLFDASPYAMGFTFSDFWVNVAEFAPAGIRGSGHDGRDQ